MPVASAPSSAPPLSAATPIANDWWHEQDAAVSATQNIEDVAYVWQQLEAEGIESPGQSLDFTRAWIEKCNIPAERQLYVTGSFNGKVVALLPLLRQRSGGLNVLTWFSGAHVGCNAPLIDRAVFAGLSKIARVEFWRKIQRGLTDVDLVRFDAMPDFGEASPFDGLGTSHPCELLYRAEFDSWEECDSIQRSRTRRKHDRQQGAKLEAMGEVTFEEVTGGPEADEAVATMFRQKSVRFQEWGVGDPFADPEIQTFYSGMLGRSGTLQARLHVLRLDGDIVAVRYNLAHGSRDFALISSMSENDDLSPGSPGKQNLLRAQMHMFSTGIKLVDMGAGYSDEKRHWCNVTIPLRNHMLPLTAKGRVAAKLIGWKALAQHRIKNDPQLFNAVKNMRAFVGKFSKRSKRG